jgi:hypothetical protein
MNYTHLIKPSLPVEKNILSVPGVGTGVGTGVGIGITLKN